MHVYFAQLVLCFAQCRVPFARWPCVCELRACECCAVFCMVCMFLRHAYDCVLNARMLTVNMRFLYTDCTRKWACCRWNKRLCAISDCDVIVMTSGVCPLCDVTGGDDVQQLCEAGEEEFLEIMALVGMASKPLHVRRLQKALQEWVSSPGQLPQHSAL